MVCLSSTYYVASAGLKILLLLCLSRVGAGIACMNHHIHLHIICLINLFSQTPDFAITNEYIILFIQSSVTNSNHST